MVTVVDPVSVLTQPVRINRLIIANRMALGPAGVHSPAPDGRPSSETLAFFERRARGGVGLIIVGGTTSTEMDWHVIKKSRPNTALRLDTDEYIVDLRRLTSSIHAHGVPVFAQINTGLGRMGMPGPHFIAASAVNVIMSEQSLACVMPVPGGMRTPTPAPASLEVIKALEQETAESALRMKVAGFDGVEIGAHMSYFLASFLSPRTNLRVDEYGGSIENRARILVNIIRRIRDGAGADFAIGVRMSANEHAPGGQGPDQYAAIARRLEQSGIDYIALTDGAYESMDLSFDGDGALIRHGEAQIFRRAVSVPIMLQGIHDPARAAEAIAAGHGDMVMLVRPMLAEPEYPNKVKAGRIQDIVRCNGDNVCLKRVMLKMPVRCPLNPALGREVLRPWGQRFRRALAAPVEGVMLKLTSSRLVMGILGKLARVAEAQ